jgi:cobalt/nickel transport protein
MSVAAVERSWVRKSVAALVVLALLAPVFGWAAGAVGYAEPIDVAAETTGAADAAEGSASVFPGYSLFGLGDSLGTLLGALVGIALTLAVSLGAGKLLEE